ncbi:TPA: hypothetical protein ROY17_001987 [Bacillus thuringiensis]|nr:hypothetical protein [Bacillus thuringiensis]
MRKIRYRQVLRHRCANHGRGTYTQQVQLQKSFWREDNTPTPTIEIVREIHNSLGTWDKLTRWESFYFGGTLINNINIIYPYKDHFRVKSVRPKANYKAIKKAKEARWKEQEKRTLEFFEREGC